MVGETRAHGTRQATKKALQAELLQCLSVLEGVSSGGGDGMNLQEEEEASGARSRTQPVGPAEALGVQQGPPGKESGMVQSGQGWLRGLVGQATTPETLSAPPPSAPGALAAQSAMPSLASQSGMPQFPAYSVPQYPTQQVSWGSPGAHV